MKTIKNNIIALVTGVILAFLSILKPVFIIFFIPIIIMLIGKKNFANKIILLIIGFLIIYIPFLYINKTGIQEQTLTIYNIFKNNIIDTNLGEIRAIEDIKLIDDFETVNNYTLVKAKEDSARLLYSSEEVYEGSRALKLEINLPTLNEISIHRTIKPENWKNYNYLNIWIKNKGKMGWFGVIIVDEDGDYWHYDNNQILKQQDWTLLKIPIRSLKNYEWTQHGNRKLDNIVEYIFKFDKFKKKINFTCYIDKIYLSKI